MILDFSNPMNTSIKKTPENIKKQSKNPMILDFSIPLKTSSPEPKIVKPIDPKTVIPNHSNKFTTINHSSSNDFSKMDTKISEESTNPFQNK